MASFICNTGYVIAKERLVKEGDLGLISVEDRIHLWHLMEYNAEFLDLAPTDLCLKQEKGKCAGDHEGNSLTERQDLLVQKQFHANTVLF